MSFSVDDQHFLQRALELARYSGTQNEVPVGAIIVLDGQIIGEGWNNPIASNDPTGHAEIIALRQAALHNQNYRLPDTTLYVTLEPCLMCAGAILHARIKRLVFGAYDPKAGAVCSMFQVFDRPELNHKVQYEGGLFADVCGKVLEDFFKSRR